jgi:hypothetical protein
MHAFIVLLGLALGLGVVMQVLREVLPVQLPNALQNTIAVAIAIGVAYGLDWSLFSAFGQHVRTAWEGPVATGLVLVGVAEFLRRSLDSIAHRS